MGRRVGGPEQLLDASPNGFEFASHARRLCDDIVRRSSHFRHIDMAKVAICSSQTRKAVQHGIWASLTSLRFEDGSLFAERNGTRYRLQRVLDMNGQEMLYIVRFYLPRFLDLSFEDSITTVVHELWHISPSFNGDIRRFDGRCQCHGPRKSEFDRQVDEVTRDYLDQSPPEELLAFLRLSAREIQERYGRIFSLRISHPRLIPVKSVPN